MQAARPYPLRVRRGRDAIGELVPSRPVLSSRARSGAAGSRHGAAGAGAAGGAGPCPRGDPPGDARLHQPADAAAGGGAQLAGARRALPGAAGLLRPHAQLARREGRGHQHGAAAPLARHRCLRLPARREAAGSGWVLPAAPHDHHRRRAAAQGQGCGGGESLGGLRGPQGRRGGVRRGRAWPTCRNLPPLGTPRPKDFSEASAVTVSALRSASVVVLLWFHFH